MFGAKRLIGTPKDARSSNDQERDLDFTPVGEEMYGSIRQENNLSPLQNRKKSSYKANVANHTINGSSFDNTSHSFDTIASESQHQHWNPQLDFLDELHKNHESDFPNLGGVDLLLTTGSNPLKQQHDNVSRLQDENLNLKVRLATLTRYFGEEPQDKKELLNNNVELKQSLIEMDNKMQQLKLYIKNLEKSSDLDEDHNSTIIEESFRMSAKANEEKHAIQRQLELAETNNKNLSMQLELLQLEKDQLDKQNEHLSHQNDRLEMENDRLLNMNEELEHENGQLNERLVHEQENLDNGENNNMQEIKNLTDEISDLQMQLRQKEDTIDELLGDVNKLRLDNRDLEEAVNELQSRLKSQNLKLKDSGVDLESRLKDAVDEVSKLSRQIKNLKHDKLRLIDDNGNLEEQLSSFKYQVDADELKISKLKSRIKDLQKELQVTRDLKDDDEYLQALERERDNLNDQLMSAEEKISLLDRELNRANFDVESLKKGRKKHDNDLINVKSLNESLQREVDLLQRKIDLLESKSQHEDHLIREIEDLKLRLASQSPNLGEQFRSSNKNSDTNPYLEQELKRLSLKNDELQHIVNSMSFNADSKQESMLKQNETLKIKIEEKENEIENLTKKLRDAMRTNKLNSLNEDDEKLDMMKEIAHLRSRLDLVNIEKDNLKEEYSMKLSIIKRQLDNESHSNIDETLQSKLQEAIKSKNKILVDLADKQQKLDELYLKNGKLSQDNKELEKIMFALEENETKLMKENKSYAKDMAKLKQTCVKLLNKLKQNPGSNIDNNFDYLQTQLDNANQEIDILTNKYLQMRKDLTSKNQSLEESKRKLKDKLIQLSEELNKTKTRHQYPTPISSPIPRSNSNSNNKRSNLYNKELKLIKLRNFEHQQTIKDLQVYSKILEKSVKKADQIMKMNIVHIDENLDRYDIIGLPRRKPLTLGVVAKFVLAGVRLRRRCEELKLNKIYMNGLNKEIKREKLDLY